MPHHVAHVEDHLGELSAHERLRLSILPDRALGDVDGLVADPFEIRDETQRGREKPEVVRDRLPQGEDPQDERMNPELVLVDLDVEVLDVADRLRGSLKEALAREGEGSLAPSPHREQMGPQLAQLGLEVVAAVGRGGAGHAVKHDTTGRRPPRAIGGKGAIDGRCRGGNFVCTRSRVPGTCS